MPDTSKSVGGAAYSTRPRGRQRANLATNNSSAVHNVQPQDDDYENATKKDKKLVFLSKSVLQKVRERPMVTGTQIANEILEMYKQFCDVSSISSATHIALKHCFDTRLPLL